MAFIIAVTGLKGGVGKSTIAANLATCYHASGRRVLAVDADPQGTLRSWAAVAAEGGVDGPPVVGVDSRALSRDVLALGRDYDVIVIDCPARLGPESRAAMMVADLVLLPSLPGPADAWALRQTLDVLSEAQALRPQLAARIILNRVDTRTTLTELARDNVSELGVELLGDGLGNRVAFAEAILAGKGVSTYAPSSPAAAEVADLYRRIRKFEQKELH